MWLFRTDGCRSTLGASVALSLLDSMGGVAPMVVGRELAVADSCAADIQAAAALIFELLQLYTKIWMGSAPKVL